MTVACQAGGEDASLGAKAKPSGRMLRATAWPGAQGMAARAAGQWSGPASVSSDRSTLVT